MVLQRKGDIGVNAMVGVAFGLLAAAALLYVWSTHLPVDTQVISTP